MGNYDHGFNDSILWIFKLFKLAATVHATPALRSAACFVPLWFIPILLFALSWVLYMHNKIMHAALLSGIYSINIHEYRYRNFSDCSSIDPKVINVKFEYCPHCKTYAQFSTTFFFFNRMKLNIVRSTDTFLRHGLLLQ